VNPLLLNKPRAQQDTYRWRRHRRPYYYSSGCILTLYRQRRPNTAISLHLTTESHNYFSDQSRFSRRSGSKLDRLLWIKYEEAKGNSLQGWWSTPPLRSGRC